MFGPGGATSGTPAKAEEKGKRCDRFWDPGGNKDCYRRIGTAGVCDRVSGAKKGSDGCPSKRKGAGARGGCSGGALGRGRVGAAAPDEGLAQTHREAWPEVGTRGRAIKATERGVEEGGEAGMAAEEEDNGIVKAEETKARGTKARGIRGQGYPGEGHQGQGDQGSQGYGRPHFDWRTAICQHCDQQGHTIRFCNIKREDERSGLISSTMDENIYNQFGEVIDRRLGGVRVEAQRRAAAGPPSPATFSLWQEKEKPPIGVEEVGSDEEVTRGPRGGSKREEPIIVESDDEDEETRVEPSSALLGKMEDLLNKVGRKEVVEVEDDDDEEEEDERLRREEDQRAEQRARKMGTRGEAEPVIRDGAPKKKKYAVRLEEGFDVEKVIERLLEGHNDLMTLKEILASAPRLRDELKGRSSRRLVPNVHLGTILPKEAKWAESGTKIDWKCVVCGTVDLVVKGSKYAAIVDTGAEMNIIREEDAIKFGLDIDQYECGILHGASCKAVFCGTASNVLIEIGKVKVRVCFFIMPDVDHGILLGRGRLKKGSQKRYKTVDKKCRPVPVLVTEDEEAYFERERGLIRQMRESVLARPCCINEGNEGKLIIGEPDFLLPQERTLMVELMKKRHRAYAFSYEERGRLDVDKIPMIRIHTVPHEPWNMRGARYPNPDEEKKVVDYLDGKIRTHVADYSSGPYASPWFCFIKPNGTLRWVQDLQRLNAVTVRDAGGMPNADALSESCVGRPIISLIDLYSRYDQFPVYPPDRPVTAMHMPRGLIHMNVAPQGWTNAVAMVQRAMIRVMQSVSPHITQPYIDDLAVKDCDEVSPGVRRFVWKHIQDLDKVLSLLEENNLMASGAKSRHCMREATILGFVCSEKGRTPDAKKTDKITEWPVPFHSITDVRSFPGKPRPVRLVEPGRECGRSAREPGRRVRGGEIKEVFRAEEYDGIYLELGLLLSCEMRLRDASDRAQRMLQRYLVRDSHLFVRREVGNPRRVVCGRNRQIDVVAALHDDIAGGHRGVQATYAKISELHYWDGMTDMVGKFCRSCVPYQERSRLRQEELLHPRLEREVGVVVHLDLLFMPLGDQGYNYIFDASDNLSGFVDGRAIRTKTGSVLVSCIEEYYLCYPFVREFVMDRGSKFTCHEVQKLLSRSDFTKTAMPRGGKGTRPPQRPLGASRGYERHGPHHQESTPVYDDGDIELFLDSLWDHARRMGWTVAQAIERQRGADRFEEPIARIRREATTRSEVEWRMQELRPSLVGPDGRPIRLEIGNASDFIPAFEWFMQGQGIPRDDWMQTLPLWTRKAERPLASQVRSMARNWESYSAHLRQAFRRPEPPQPRVERRQRSQRQRDPEPTEARPSRGGRKALARREEEPEPEAEEQGAYPECGLGSVEFHRFAKAIIKSLRQRSQGKVDKPESSRQGEQRQSGHGLPGQPSATETSQEPPMGRVILEPEEARAQREAEREAFEFRAPTELATLPIAAAGPVIPLSDEEGLPPSSSEPDQGSTEGSMDVLIEAVHSMQEEASLFSPEQRIEEPLEREMGIEAEGVIEGKHQRLGTPEYGPGGIEDRLGPSTQEMETGEEPLDMPQSHGLSREASKAPSSPESQRGKKRSRKWFDTSCFFCTKEGHRALQCPKFLKDKAEGKVTEEGGRMYDRQGRRIERSADGGRAQLYRQNRAEMSNQD
ncbi:hypothetical protein CBR_g52318 [Chara braunii]|uniref:CCHC-type domain-containing protein n=1 Tax=Chara braunii TaxID=69332 RepID=A0A388K702_CHABU|nr:hypothetical protein CBR_g52318 [Chara braunii]|eukprot:GBG65723.1 hypothetical protein CBR_g52318 [Chara braunii]